MGEGIIKEVRQEYKAIDWGKEWHCIWCQFLIFMFLCFVFWEIGCFVMFLGFCSREHLLHKELSSIVLGGIYHQF